MNRIRPFAVTLAAILMLGVASLAFAQQSEDVEETGAVTGQITNIDLVNKKLTVAGSNDDGGTYSVGADTSIMSGGNKIGLRDLQKGWRVVVNFDATLKGNTNAKLIEVVEAPMP